MLPFIIAEVSCHVLNNCQMFVVLYFMDYCFKECLALPLASFSIIPIHFNFSLLLPLLLCYGMLSLSLSLVFFKHFHSGISRVLAKAPGFLLFPISITLKRNNEFITTKALMGRLKFRRMHDQQYEYGIT